ncbi:energy transducer TonB [Chryseobacterium aahli]|uniref:energy transducer TonB n=1 Tax=Chryseobacterium aahli TaxID=1278643 RepID=UPI001F60D1A0|nr:energy transducer TonB [Chryseobacterium aahli]MCI3938771.1 energy transducer TonB [Chryseobacterium aahli]
MRKLILFSTVLFSYFANAQEVAGTTELEEVNLKKYKTEIFNVVEKPAEFPKGLLTFRELFAKKFKERKVISNGEEKCELTFVIQKDGTLTEIKAIGNNESFNNEAIRAISKIKEKWIPAEINGNKVRYRFRLPLTMKFK